MIVAGHFLQLLLFPTGLVFLCLLGTVLCRHSKKWSLGFGLAGLVILFVSSNLWVANQLVGSLEGQYQTPNPIPTADVIVVLSGGKCPQFDGNAIADLGEGGDRVAYGDYLFRQGKATAILCTGGVGPGEAGVIAGASNMKAFYRLRGVPEDSIIVEDKAGNTRQHPIYCRPICEQRKFKKIILVTSAFHMPRSVAVFKKLCPDIEIIPTPTDFQTTKVERNQSASGIMCFPRAEALQRTTIALHEYVGIAYYKLRGWM